MSTLYLVSHEEHSHDVIIGDAVTEETWTMAHGFPVSWASAWAKLAWQHSRPNKPKGNTRREGGGAAEMSNDAAQPAASSSATGAQKSTGPKPLEIVNGVTARNNKRSSKERAKLAVAREDQVASMSEHIVEVKKDQLVFVDVSSMETVEGEMAIGLARAKKDCNSGECELMWYVRSEWVSNQKHVWGKTPTFEVAGDPDDSSRAYMTTEPFNKILPLKIVLTGKQPKGSGSRKGKLLRITYETVCLAREVCKQRNLMRRDPTVVVSRNMRKRRANRLDDSSEEEDDSSEESDEESDCE